MKPMKMLGSVAAIVIVTLTVLVGCGSAASSGEPPNTDPRVDWVSVFDGNTTKRCDGLNLLYGDRDGLAVVPNSPECQPL